MSDIVASPSTVEQDEITYARLHARQYLCTFIDLDSFQVQLELIRSMPLDMLLHYSFIPIEQLEDQLVIAVSDPSRLMLLDELSNLLGQRLVTRVATLSQINDLLRKANTCNTCLMNAKL